MENSVHLTQNVGVRWSVPHPMGLKVWRLQQVTASSPSWGVAVCRSCLWGIWTFKTLSRVNLSSVVDWQSHVPSTHSVPWLFGVSEDCFLGRKNYKVAQSCWLCWSVQLFGPCAKALFGLGQLGEESVLKGNVSCCGLMALQTINVLEHYATVWDWSLLLPRDPVSSPPVSRGRRWQTMLWCCSMIHRGELKSKPNQKEKAGWCFSELCPQIVVGKGLPLRPQSMSLIQMSSWNAACIPAFDLGAQDYGSVIRPLQQAEEFMRSRLYFISPWFTEGDSCK